jgi:hypothetical protein
MAAHSTWNQWATRRGRALLFAFNVRALGLIALSCISVAVSSWLGLTYNIEFSFVALGACVPSLAQLRAVEG